MTPLRVLVADDEPLARRILVELLRQDPQVGDIEECASGPDLLRATQRRHVDVAFVDIEMPEASGLDVVTTPGCDVGAVVFVTAFSEYAVRAFEAEAVDYLLKPFSDARFVEAFERAKRRARQADQAAKAGPHASLAAPDAQFLTRIAFRDGVTSHVIPVRDILWVEAQDYYVNVHVANKRHLMRATLADFERRLDPARFIRVHRGAIVNIDRVARTLEREALVLVLTDGTELTVSRARRRQVRQALLPSLRR